MITYVYITYCYLLSSFVLLFVMAFDFFLYLGGYRNNTAVPQHPPGVYKSYPQVIHRQGKVIHRQTQVIHRLSTGSLYKLSTGASVSVL